MSTTHDVGATSEANLLGNQLAESEALCKYFRLPQSWIQVYCNQGDTGNDGFFAFGEDTVCFGGCSSVPIAPTVKHPLADALRYAQVGTNSVHLPFNLDDVVYNLHNERYALSESASPLRKIIRRAYYWLRPALGVRVRRYLQRVYFSGWESIPFPHWPVDRSVDRLMERVLALGIKASGGNPLPFIWFWPEGHNSACIVTHDVETATGRDFCSKLMDLDDSCGMKSAFQVIPEKRYEVPAAFLADIRARQFEVNVHDLNHDGLLFSNKQTFMQRVGAINRYGKQFGAIGFRSGIMYRNQEWFDALDFEYDMSVPNIAHFEPQRGGCCTIMPFFIGNLLELPLTTTQDYTLFHILGLHTLDIWEREIDAVHRNHGLISILVHPDYILEPREQGIYLRLLRHIAGRASKENIWLTTPSEVNNWWRIRSKLSLEQKDGSWQIVGDGCDRARIAYACLDGESLRYSLTSDSLVGQTR